MPVQFPLPGLSLPCPPVSHPAEVQLSAYPAVSPAVLSRHAKLLGAAGEALVDSHLGRWGMLSLPVPESLPYDRLVVIGRTLLRVQVKTASVARGGAFNFEIAQGYRGAPAGVRGYAADAFDLLALVVLPHNAVAFTADLGRRHRLPVAAIPGLLAAPRASLARALDALGLPEAVPAPRIA